MPAYEGKRQPRDASSWFQGFASWWSGSTPHYVTRSSGAKVIPNANAPAPNATASGAPSAPSSPPATSGDAPSGSRGTAPAVSRDPSAGGPK